MMYFAALTFFVSRFHDACMPDLKFLFKDSKHHRILSSQTMPLSWIFFKVEKLCIAASIDFAASTSLDIFPFAIPKTPTIHLRKLWIKVANANLSLTIAVIFPFEAIGVLEQWNDTSSVHGPTLLRFRPVYFQ